MLSFLKFVLLTLYPLNILNHTHIIISHTTSALSRGCEDVLTKQL